MPTLTTLTTSNIDRDWRKLSNSRKTINELQLIIKSSEELAAHKPTDIISIISSGKNTGRLERDLVLMGLFTFVGKTELASRLIFQSLWPQILHLVKRTNFAEPEERVSAISAIAMERVMIWRPKTSNFCHLNLYSFVHKKTMRIARKDVSQRCETWESITEEPKAEEPEYTYVSTLIDWVTHIGDADLLTAEMVVLTRCGYSSIEQYSKVTGLSQQTLRQRRLRTEGLMRQKLNSEKDSENRYLDSRLN